MSNTRKLVGIVLTVVVGLVLIQLVPYGRQHVNPPNGALVAFDTPSTESLAKRACFDCHSNETHWPWYASIAPISWRIQHHVMDGREKLNFTAFDPTTDDAKDAAGEAGESVTKGQMPPKDYLIMHPEARLTRLDAALLAKGLDATFVAFSEERRPAAAREGATKGAGEQADRDD